MLPSQLSSIPLHTSGFGPMPPEHSILPALQILVPNSHAPMSVPHGSPTGEPKPSLSCPSQSLSTESQTSVAGNSPPLQVQPKAPLHESLPAVHGAASV